MFWLAGRYRLFVLEVEPYPTSLDMKNVSSFASPTVSKRLESVWKRGPLKCDAVL